MTGSEPARFPDAAKWFRFAWLLLSSLPSRRGSRVRVRLLRLAGATVGERVRVGSGVRVLAPAGLTIGDGTGIARDACLDARGTLVIGADCMVGFESALISLTHRYDNVDVLLREQGMEPQSIVVGNGVWIGARAFVMPGVEIGDETIIGTMSVVTRTIPANVVAAGSPAKVLRER